MNKKRRASPETLAILSLFVSNKDRYWHGYGIKKEIPNIPHPTIYSVLLRLNRYNYVERMWQMGINNKKRHIYRLNNKGLIYAAQEMACADNTMINKAKALREGING